MNQPFLLFQVQKIDSEIDNIDKRSTEIARLLANNQILLAAEMKLEEADRRLNLARKALKDIEDAVEKVQIKIQTSESSLYGGKIRVPKELQDLQNEIAALKKHLASQEDRQLEAILAMEESEKAFGEAGAELEKAKAEFANQTASLQGEKTTIEKKKERLLSERAAAVTPIEPEFMAIYDRFRKQKRGIAIAGVSEDSCSACGAGLTPAESQSARSNQKVVYCPQCGRMLYGG